MKSRAGVSFVPPMHDSEEGSPFYIVDKVISSSGKLKLGEWVANPNKFSAEAPRSEEQCLHVDGATKGKCLLLQSSKTINKLSQLKRVVLDILHVHSELRIGEQFIEQIAKFNIMGCVEDTRKIHINRPSHDMPTALLESKIGRRCL